MCNCANKHPGVDCSGIGCMCHEDPATASVWVLIPGNQRLISTTESEAGLDASGPQSHIYFFAELGVEDEPGRSYYKSSITGEFVSETYALRHGDTTYHVSGE